MNSTSAHRSDRSDCWAIQRVVWSRGPRVTWRTVSPRPMPYHAALRALMTFPCTSRELRLITGVPALMRFGAIERAVNVHAAS